MPDFRALVREQIAALALSPAREQKIVEEWAAELGAIYEGLRADGLSETEAWRELRQQLPDARQMESDLLDQEPLVVRLAAAEGEPRSARTLRALIASGREQLTAGLLRDLAGSVRVFIKDRGFSATVVLTLAICLGANAAVFTVVNAVLLRPLPVPHPEQIVGIGDVYPTITPNDILANDVPSYFDRRAALTTLDEQALFAFWFDTFSIDGAPQELRGMRATPSLFGVLQVAPALGRTFTEAEGENGDGQQIILSHALWHTLYGGDPTVLGQDLRLGWTGKRYTIVGVMPRDFSFFDRGYDGHAGASSSGVQFWIPLVFTPEQKSDSARTRYGFFHIGRLKPGATVQQLQEQLDALRAANGARFPQFRYDELGMYTAATPLHEALTRPIRRTLYLLWAGAGFVLLIGAINIANLSLARAVSRRRELATRLALGAGRAQVARQLMIEALVPAAIGGAAGVAIGAAILRVIASAGMEDLPHAAGIRIDASTVAFIAVVSAGVALVIGAFAATTASAATISAVLGDGSRSGTAGRSARLFRRGLVITQVALSVVLLIGGTLLLTSFRHLLNGDAGFSRKGVVTGTVFPPPSRYPDARAVAALLDRIRERVGGIPGVDAVGLTSNIALSGSESPSTVAPVGRAPTDTPLVPTVVTVTPGYFEAMATPIVRGRDFSEADREGSQAVAVVDERLAGRLWPGEDPIGRAINRGPSGPYVIVGIVRDVRFESLTGSIDAIGTAYFPHANSPPMGRLRWLAVRSAGDPAAVVSAIRAALLDIDRDLPLSDIQTMGERTARSLASQRLAMGLAAMFAVIALLLSMLGIYGVLAHLVVRRSREIGIRLALGSTVRAVFYLVLREGAVLIGIGLLLGLAGAVAMARALKGLVFGVEPTDPALLGSVAIVTGCVALIACLAPARRATRVDPVNVLAEP